MSVMKSALKSCKMETIVKEGSLFDKWFNKEISGLGSFDQALFEAFILASGNNRDTLTQAFPEKFKGTQSFL